MSVTQNYRINYAKELGHGATGQVYPGERRSDSLEVAVKVIFKRSLDKKQVTHIQNEIISLRELSIPSPHPNVIQLYDMYEDRAAFYLCLELVSGGEMFDRIETKTFYEEAEARRLIIHILEGIKHCHDRDIVHRDLKPENFMMVSREDDSAVKIVDFGFSNKAKGIELTGVLGTPMYMSPEVWLDQPHGKPTDMWSIGVIVYVVLCGYPPFYDDNRDMLVKRIVKSVYAFHEEYWFAISTEAKDFVTQLLKVDMNVRMTVDQALGHPWLGRATEELRTNVLTSNLDKLREFNASRKLAGAVNTIMITKRFAKKFRATHHVSENSSASTSPVDLTPLSELRGLYSSFDHGDEICTERMSVSESGSELAATAPGTSVPASAVGLEDIAIAMDATA